MKPRNLSYLSVLALLLVPPTFAEEEGKTGHAEEQEGASPSVGPNKAILAANRKDGLQLSDKAKALLGLAYEKVKSTNLHRVPASCAVYFQDEIGVYRVRGGWIKLIEIEIKSRTATEIVFESSDIQPGDELVKSGVPLLRVAELEAWGGSGEGHGH